MSGRDETPFVIRNRSTAGGLNTRVFALDIQDDEAQLLQNVDCSTPGQRTIRDGTSVCATGITAGPILALGTFTPDGGVPRVLAISPDHAGGDGHNRLWEWDGTGAMFTEVGTLTTWTALPGNVSISIVPAFEVSAANSNFQVLLSSSQSAAPNYYYDGTALAVTGAGGSAGTQVRHYQTYHHDRMIATGDGLYRSDFVVSDAGHVTNEGGVGPWVSPVQFRVAAGKAQSIVRMIEFRNNNVVVFLTDSIKAVNTSTDSSSLATVLSGGYWDPATAWSIIDVHDTIGCAGFHAVANIGEDIYFADQHGNIRSLARMGDDAGQGVKSLPVSEPIHAWIQRINPTAKDRIVLQAHDRWLLVGLPIDTAVWPSHVFALDTARSSSLQRLTWDGPWTSSNGAMQPFSMVEAILSGASDDDDQNPTVYAGSSVTTAGEVYRYFRGDDDNGTAIEYQEITKRYNQNTLALDKVFTRMNLYAVGSGLATLQVEANLDARGWEHVGYVDLSGDTPLLPQALPLQLGGSGVVESVLDLGDLDNKIRAKDISFRLTATATADVKLLGYNVAGYLETWDREPRDA